MESHWSAMHPKRTQEYYKVPHSECAELVFSHSWCIACAPIVLQQGLLRLHNECGITRFDPRNVEHANTLNTFLVKLYHMANDVLTTVQQSVEDGVNTFTIDHSSKGLPRT